MPSGTAPRKEQTHQIEQEGILRGLRQKAKALGQEVESEARERALAEADQERQNAEGVTKMVTARSDAEKLHETAARYGAVADALGPQGVRQRLLDKGLRRLNLGLAVLADAAEWPAVEVVETGAVTIGGRAATLCSESEQWAGAGDAPAHAGAADGLDRGGAGSRRPAGPDAARRAHPGGAARHREGSGGGGAVQHRGSGRNRAMAAGPAPADWGGAA